MMTLKYLRGLSKERLEKEYKYNREWQLKWYDIWEEYHKKGIRDRMVTRHFDYYTNAVNKIKKVMKERGLK